MSPLLRADRAQVWSAYGRTRSHSAELVAGLTPEDQGLQSMPDASPTKWHLAHTTWFFEAVVLQPHVTAHRAFNAEFSFLFNSYYESLGPRHPRPQRGLLSRPPVSGVWAYRQYVDKAMLAFISTAGEEAWAAAAPLIELGLHHEQQHQELIATDILHAFSLNPTLPAWHPNATHEPAAEASPVEWLQHERGMAEIGHSGEGFSFDNETPRHRVWLEPFEIANRLVTNAEFMQFIDDGGYRNPALWLSEGWAQVQNHGWTHPLYWIAPGDPRAPAQHWQTFGATGVQPFDSNAPVSQLSFYEAAAYAQWAGARLPTEAEWEVMSAAKDAVAVTGVVWQWTRSSYDPYPRFKPLAGAVAEYNGKFMVGQMVLRGGSEFTPTGHTRRTYRNFFPPTARWQFSGVRLARDLA
ncbi:ergothioneine biosynthesis protein EgtB [Caenimonas soli]|uniref:ergothioneine biosynthesis protein EgtB n=1 Tax=Caenimonas soli TaxID=2735555 RepID=UPI00155804CB|nr:ergothioneine biosynthesis protein EgtB [Caenimonas soli]NPC58505.1 ergothioneine biosynthesis protein EgtB [Caenimonas soli]